MLTFVTDGVGDGLAGLPDLNKLLASRWASPPPIADFINHVGYDAEQFLDGRVRRHGVGRPPSAAAPVTVSAAGGAR